MPELVTNRLEEAIPDLMELTRVPGLSIALVRDGAIAWARGFGVKDTGSGEPVDADTVFQAASLSKPAFAYAALMLVERGLFDLDAPLSAYLPEPYAPDDPLLDKVTARHVLCHTTGWPNWRPRGGPLVRDRAPGERFGYSGEGYNYLQQAVERLAGQPLDLYMRDALLDPLGMARSTYAWAAPGDPAVAASHDRAGEPCDPFVGAGPEAAGSLHSTARDYARFLRAMLSAGDGPGLLRAETVAEMLRPQVRLDEALSWGLGWGLEDTGAGRAFWQWGDSPGYKHIALALPETRAGLVVMTNGDGGLALWEPIVRLALGGEHLAPAFAWLAKAFYGVPTLADALL